MWDNFKHPNIFTVGVFECRRERGIQKKIEEIGVEIFLNFMKTIAHVFKNPNELQAREM